MNKIIGTPLTICIFNFLLLSAIGLLLRYLNYYPIFFINYKYVLEAHSHFAFSGVLLLFNIVALRHSNTILETTIPTKLFYIFLAESYIMLIVFAVYGYAAPSIIASTFYLLTTYYLAYILYTSGKKMSESVLKTILNYAVFFLLLSSLAPWCMGPLMAMKYAGKPIYYNTVYFYLHFQYNGFFTFCVLFLIVQNLLVSNKIKNLNELHKGIHLFAIASVLTYFISVLWCEPKMTIRVFAFIGSILQIIAVHLLFKNIESKTPFSILIKFIFSCFLLKIVLMCIIAFPLLSFNTIANRHVIIAFMHLTFIGTLWLSLWYFIHKYFGLRAPLLNTGIAIFLVSFILMEMVLLSSIIPTISKLVNPFFNGILFVLSLTSTTGIGLLIYETRIRRA